jgi:hypothetical protein
VRLKSWIRELMLVAGWRRCLGGSGRRSGLDAAGGILRGRCRASHLFWAAFWRMCCGGVDVRKC